MAEETFMAEETASANLLSGPGQPIAKSTGELMMALYQARIKAVASQAPNLGVVVANEPKLLYFSLDNLNTLLAALNTGSKYVAACLGLTVLDAEDNPTVPTSQQLALMQELVELQAAGDYEGYEAKVQDIKLGQTVLIAGCDETGNLNVQSTGVYSFYDMAGTNGMD